MADDGGETTPYEWFLYLCRRTVHWGSFSVAGIGTLLIFWFHWGNAYSEYGVKWYDVATAGKCTPMSVPNPALYTTPPTATGPATIVVPSMYADRYAAIGKVPTAAPPGKVPFQTAPKVVPAVNQYCALDTTTWCRVKGTGDALLAEPAKSNGGWDCSPLSDNNKDWRKIFTFKPNAALDMFTPVVIGAIETIQHLGPTYLLAQISGTWIVRAIWLFSLSLFAQFGYAGDLGVTLGYIVDFAVVLPCIALAILDHESDEAGLSVTTADVLPTLKYFLEMCGLDGLCPGLTAVKAREITKDDGSLEQMDSA